jgi:hypothetical protein
LRASVSLSKSVVLQCEVLSRLLWDERQAGAKLFEAVDMVTFNTSPILLVKVIRSQVAIRLFGS